MGGWRNWSQNALSGPPLPAPPSFTGVALAALAGLRLLEDHDLAETRYPGYDVLDKRDTPSWNEKTREVIGRRLTTPGEPRFFDQKEWAMVQALADRIVPQPRQRDGNGGAIPVAGLLDTKLLENHQDGYRSTTLPPQREAWKRGLRALDAEAHGAHNAPFSMLDGEQQDALLKKMESATCTTPPGRECRPRSSGRSTCCATSCMPTTRTRRRGARSAGAGRRVRVATCACKPTCATLGRPSRRGLARTAGPCGRRTSVSAAEHLVDRAMRIAMGESRVTALIFPKDVQEEKYENPPRMHNTVHSGIGYSRPKTVPYEADLRRAAEVLNAGKKVAMLVGAGALDATDEIMAVADRLGAGCATALLGKMALPSDLPWNTECIGLLGTKPSSNMMDECDTLFMIGSGFPWSEFLPKEGNARGVQIDIKPEMLSIRYPMEVNLTGDSKDTLKALLPMLQQKTDEVLAQEHREVEAGVGGDRHEPGLAGGQPSQPAAPVP